MADEKILPPHVERMIDERADLDVKIASLAIFMSSGPDGIFAKLEKVDRELLDAQYFAMTTYRRILAIRIGRAGF